MVFYVGGDLLRWIEQCMEHVDRLPELRDLGLRPQSFAAHLVQNTPPTVEAKLKSWGVSDYRAIFTRALGLNALFMEVPPRDILSDDFLRNYYRFADQMFQCKQNQSGYAD